MNTLEIAVLAASASTAISVAALLFLSLKLRRLRAPAAKTAKSALDQRVLLDFAKVAVAGAEARYGEKNGPDKARFARQAVMDHAAAIGTPCTGIQADALIHAALAAIQ